MTKTKRPLTFLIAMQFLAVASLALMLTGQKASAASRIVAVVNGTAITDFDISQRQKLERLLSGGKRRPSTSATLNTLIDDRLKLFEAQRRSRVAADAEISNAMTNMARNARIKKNQLISVLKRNGIAKQTLENWLKVQISWNALLRSRFNAQVHINDSEIVEALAKNKEKSDKTETAYRFDLTQITFVTRANASKSELNQQLAAAKRLRARFKSCDSDIEFARGLPDVAIARAGRRTSTDLPSKLAKIILDTPIGSLTPPKKSKNGYDMLAVCGKKSIGTDEVLRKEAESKLKQQHSKSLSRKYILELRSTAVIEKR